MSATGASWPPGAGGVDAIARLAAVAATSWVEAVLLHLTNAHPELASAPGMA
jgi:hypothetical protein